MTVSRKAKTSSPHIISLPKKVKRTEAGIDGEVAEKLRRLHAHKNWALEVKMKGGKFLDHQKAALKQVENGKFLYKLPDMGKRNPFDYVFLGDADAIYCVVDGRRVACQVNGGVIKYDFNL